MRHAQLCRHLPVVVSSRSPREAAWFASLVDAREAIPTYHRNETLRREPEAETLVISLTRSVLSSSSLGLPRHHRHSIEERNCPPYTVGRQFSWFFPPLSPSPILPLLLILLVTDWPSSQLSLTQFGVDFWPAFVSRVSSLPQTHNPSIHCHKKHPIVLALLVDKNEGDPSLFLSLNGGLVVKTMTFSRDERGGTRPSAV